MEAAPHPWPALGVLLLRDGLVTKDELEEILAQQRDTRQQRVSGRRLGEILIQRGTVTPTQVARLVAEQYELPFVDFDVADIDSRLATLLREDDARRFSALPISRRADGTYLLAIADPGTVLFSEELRAILGSVPSFAVVGPDAIERAIDMVYSQPLVIEPVADQEPAQEEAIVLNFPPGGPVITVFDEPELEMPRSEVSPLLGALLIRDGFVTQDELETALAQQRLSPELRLGEILVEKGLVSRAVLTRLLAEQYELRYFDLGAVEIDRDVASRLPEAVARALVAVPIAEHGDGSLDVAISDPTQAAFSDELYNALGVPLTIVMASPDAILAVLDDLQAPSFTPGEPVVTAGEVVDVTGEPEAAEVQPADLADAPVDTDASIESFEVVESTHDSDPVEEPEFPEPMAWQIVREPIEPVEISLEDAAAELDDDAEPQEAELTDDAAEMLHWLPADEPEFVESAASEPAMTETERSQLEALAMSPADEETLWVGRLELVDDVTEDADQGNAEETRDEHEFDPFLPQVEPAPLLDSEDHAEDAVFEAEETPAPFARVPLEEAEEAESGAELLGAEDEDTVFEAEETPAPFARVPLEEAEEAESGAELLDAEGEEAAVEEYEFAAEAAMAEFEAQAVIDHHAEETAEADVESEPFEPNAFDAALAAGASSFHFTPAAGELAVRARVDGVVRDLGTVSWPERDALVARLEAEGAVRAYVSETSRGAKTTLFVANPVGVPTTLDELGSGATAADALKTALDRAAGAVLVCGPVGSGTTTTLYAAVSSLAGPDRVVTSFEYPVERHLDGVDQIEMDPARGLTFASSLRDLRFTDPDAVLVGDLPDLETTELALRAASEGRLVLASFRAPGAAAAIRRLAEIGIDTTTLSLSLSCVLAQRLVRVVCSNCSETYPASDVELGLLGESDEEGPPLLTRGAGCTECGGSGFRGRTALFEVMPVTDDVRELVGEGASAKKIQRAAVSAGMRTLREEAFRLCREGITSVSEIERILGLDG